MPRDRLEYARLCGSMMLAPGWVGIGNAQEGGPSYEIIFAMVRPHAPRAAIACHLPQTVIRSTPDGGNIIETGARARYSRLVAWRQCMDRGSRSSTKTGRVTRSVQLDA